MYTVVYRWRLKQGQEQDFRNAWWDANKAIQAHFGNCGFRLYESEDGLWIAYAQWASEEDWTRAQHEGVKVLPEGALDRMNGAIEETLPLVIMSMVDDLPLAGGDWMGGPN